MTTHTYNGNDEDNTKVFYRYYYNTDDGFYSNHSWEAYMGSGNDYLEYNGGAVRLADGYKNKDLYAELGSGNDDFLAKDCEYLATNFSFTVYGGSGNDTMEITCNKDREHWLYGEEGDDTALGEQGSENLYGGDGDDYLAGRRGEDYLYGGADNDVLFGGWDQDYLDGGDGNDFIDPGVRTGSDIDTVYGGTGKDIVTSGDFDSSIADSSSTVDWENWGIGQTILRTSALGASTATQGNPLVSAMYSTGTSALMTSVNSLMNAGTDSQSEVSQADYVDFLDFDEQDIFIVTSSDEFGDIRGVPSTSHGDFTVNADQTSGGNGGIVAILSPGSSFSSYIYNNLNSTSVSLNTALGQIFEVVDKTRLEITRDGSNYYDGDGNQYDTNTIDSQLDAFNVSSNTSAQDFFNGLELESGDSLYIYGAFAGRFFQGANIADTGNGTDRFIAGTDNADALAVHGFTDTDDDPIEGRLYGLDGDDLLIGAGGTDYIYGGRGADIIVGHGGQDYLWGDGDSTSSSSNEFKGGSTDLFVVDGSHDVIKDFNFDISGYTNKEDIIMIRLGENFDESVHASPYQADGATWQKIWWENDENPSGTWVYLDGINTFYFSELLQCSTDGSNEYYVAASTDLSLLPTDTVNGGCWESYFD